MPQPLTLKTIEIFPSVQGEGLRQGEPTIFVRLSGCNLSCSFCDTKYAWEGGIEMSVDRIRQIIKKIREKFPAQWICLTGGEPLLQNILELVESLKKEGHKIQVETNGTIYQPLPIDWYTVSPKPDKYFFQPRFKQKASEVKVIITRDLKFDVIEHLRQQFPKDIPLLLQPQSNKKWSVDLGMRILKKTLSAGLQNIRLSVQLHKFYNLR
jgi:organic radical activating enzyme